MIKRVFSKILSANDVAATGAHQGGILIPKSEAELLSFLPFLDPAVKNPDAWIECEDEMGEIRRFRFVYYNNKLHDSNGTRNEYRVTYMTKYFRELGAREGEALEISRFDSSDVYRIRIVRTTPASDTQQQEDGVRIKIKSGWRRVH